MNGTCPHCGGVSTSGGYAHYAGCSQLNTNLQSGTITLPPRGGERPTALENSNSPRVEGDLLRELRQQLALEQQRREWIAAALHGDPVFGAACQDPLFQQAVELRHELSSARQQLVAAQKAALNGCKKPHRLDELDFAGCAACAWDAYHEQRARAETAEEELSSIRAVRTLAVEPERGG